MPRHFWIAASIAVLVAAFALLAFALPGLAGIDGSLAREDVGRPAALEVVTYQVPPLRAEGIRSTMNSALLVNKQDVQPLGQASLAGPGQLVVSAPSRMQGSIRKAITMLSQEEASQEVPGGSASIDIWLVEAATGAGADDPRLATAGDVLEAARQRFGHERYRLLERVVLATSLGGSQGTTGGERLRQASVQLMPHDARTLEVQLEIQTVDANRGASRFASTLLLPENEWQLVGLQPGSAGTPERLVLLRQVPMETPDREQ